MAKFPSQRKIVYDVADISATTMASEGYLNIPKDLSILNRRGYASTTRKGVPLVYQVKVDWYLHDDLGTGPSTAYGADLQATMKMVGCQNNWVMKNAVVKLHAARELWLSRTGVPKKNRGAYAHEIRYVLDTHDQTWLTPIDGDGAALAGGTWDVTKFADDLDNSYQVKLIGSAVDESVATTGDSFHLGALYLNSRANIHTDTNVEADDTPTRYSHLQFMMGQLSVDEQQDVAISNIQGEQDNPPYDPWEDGDTNNDITESVELGRAVAGFGNAFGSTIMEIPFGLANLRAQVHDAQGTDVTTNGLICVEVLDIYEMQG